MPTDAFIEELVGRLGEGPLHHQVEALASSRLFPSPTAKRRRGTDMTGGSGFDGDLRASTAR